MNTLETAANPEGLRRVAIDPVSRVEGHGKVTILLDAHNRVQQVRLHIVEFRGFEKFIEGRPYWEVPVMVQRLCGICPVSHHLAATKAFDRVIGAMPPTASADKIRRLMHYGQVLQSHALHFFHLSSPDLLFGFDSEVNRRNIVGVARAHPEVARKGVTVNAICPGYTETDIVREAVQNIVIKTGKSEAEARQALAARNPQHRLVQPQEVAQSVLWLCASGSDAINGQAIAIDGGELAG